jgi:hypothetical protein
MRSTSLTIAGGLCLAALAAPPGAAASPPIPTTCNHLLTNHEAGIALGGLTKGYVEDGTVHPWPRLANRICTWQGKVGQLTLTVYYWPNKTYRDQFTKQALCRLPHHTAACAQARHVRDELAVGVASYALANVLRHEMKDIGVVREVPGVEDGYAFQPDDTDLGTAAWGPYGDQVMLVLSCNAFDHDDIKAQDTCAARALQLADLNGR